MKKLIDGLRTFVSTLHPKERALYDSLARGQSPETLFITCSDSRVTPMRMTATGPGDLFVVRNAGNIVPPSATGSGEAASIEYAVEVLKVRDVVVCGHSDCGAMKAVLDPGAVRALPAVARWLEHTDRVREIVAQAGELPPEERLARAIEINVLTQMGHLRSHPSVGAALERGEIAVHGWVWDIATGRVRAFDSDEGAFVDLLEQQERAAE